MNNTYLIELIISGLILLFLIINIKTSRRFNFYDHLLHHKFVKTSDNLLCKLVAVLNEPKLVVVWDFSLALLLVFMHRNLEAIWVLGTLAVTDSIGIFLKHSVKRKRPFKLDQTRDGYSFPSGHVLSTTILFLMIWHLFGNVFGVGLIIILISIWGLVIFSRLSMRAHYPSDVLGATSLAVLCFSLAQVIL